MEFDARAQNYLHVKLKPKASGVESFAHPALVNTYTEGENLVLVFEPGDVNGILRAILDYFPGAEVLDTGLYPSLGRLSGYRLRYGPLTLISPGEGVTPQPGEIVLETDFSFGSGFHPTTKLSALLLAELFEQERPRRVFDLGTGSGVLALCAASLGAAQVLAADIDERAVREAWKNVRRNRYEDRILVVKGSLSCGREHFFELLLANLTIGTILTLGSEFPAVLAPGGFMILSGFTVGQVEEVRGLFPQARLVKTLEEEGWAAVLLAL